MLPKGGVISPSPFAQQLTNARGIPIKRALTRLQAKHSITIGIRLCTGRYEMDIVLGIFQPASKPVKQCSAR